jgi:hypothetical protein
MQGPIKQNICTPADPPKRHPPKGLTKLVSNLTKEGHWAKALEVGGDRPGAHAPSRGAD